MTARGLDEIAAAVGGEVRGSGGSRPTGYSIDSRTLRSGDLFFAIVGPNQDGHRYVRSAMEKGASGAVVSEAASLPDGTPGIVVGDTTRALQELAIARRRRIKPRVIGITGSAGKTTTKEMTRQVLDGSFRVMASRGNYNNLYGLPLSLLGLEEGDQVAVLEMGISTHDEMDRLAEIGDPDVGVLTNLHGAHLASFADVEDYARAKGRLFQSMRQNTTGIFNADEERSRKLASSFHGFAVTFGTNERSEFRGTGFRSRGLRGSELTVAHGDRQVPVRLRFAGVHHAMNALAAIAAGFMLGCDLETMAARLEKLDPLPMRGRVLTLGGRVHVLDDSYNANPAAMQAALAVLATAERGGGRRIAILGDMLELGADEADRHRELGRRIAESGIDLAFLVGPLSAEAVAAARESGFEAARHFESAEEAAAAAREEIGSGDTVLVKASRGIGLDRVVRALEESLGSETEKGGAA